VGLRARLAWLAAIVKTLVEGFIAAAEPCLESGLRLRGGRTAELPRRRGALLRPASAYSRPSLAIRRFRFEREVRESTTVLAPLGTARSPTSSSRPTGVTRFVRPALKAKSGVWCHAGRTTRTSTGHENTSASADRRARSPVARRSDRLYSHGRPHRVAGLSAAPAAVVAGGFGLTINGIDENGTCALTRTYALTQEGR
jgi:hypothetical protein